jgi:hypothetical protein
MEAIPVPFAEETTLPRLRQYLDENGQVRLEELRDDLGGHVGRLAPALFELLEDGEVSLLAVNDVVVIRPE